MASKEEKLALHVMDVEVRKKKSSYPKVIADMFEGREKRQLGDVFGLKNFGVNLTTLKPGARSALKHAHALQDEFIYVLSGTPTLIIDEASQVLEPGMCAGFPAANGEAHYLINQSQDDVLLLEVGDRTKGRQCYLS